MKTYFVLFDGTKIRYDLNYPPFTPEVQKWLKHMKVDLVATFDVRL